MSTRTNRPVVRTAARPHNRATIVTTTKKSFDRVKKLVVGESITIECPNDIISSARGGADNVHHSIRRVSLLKKQIAGGFNRVKVRYEQGNEIYCVLVGKPVGKDDDCSFTVSVKR